MTELVNICVQGLFKGCGNFTTAFFVQILMVCALKRTRGRNDEKNIELHMGV